MIDYHLLYSAHIASRFSLFSYSTRFSSHVFYSTYHKFDLLYSFPFSFVLFVMQQDLCCTVLCLQYMCYDADFRKFSSKRHKMLAFSTEVHCTVTLLKYIHKYTTAYCILTESSQADVFSKIVFPVSVSTTQSTTPLNALMYAV